MLRSTASIVMWVGRATVFLVGLAVILSLIFGVVSRATAHTGSAGLFHLNHNNPVTALSTLTGTLAGAVLKVDNNGTGPALSLEVGSGKAPLTVNSTAGKATNLNADKIDGREASSFANGVGGKATNAEQLDGIDSTGFALANRTPMWAVINSNGTTARSFGVTSSINHTGVDGSYGVVFNRDVSGCAYVASLGDATINTDHGEVSAVRQDGVPNGVFVKTFNSSGVAVDLPFHLAVLC